VSVNDLNILVVEREPSVALVISSALERRGHEVAVVATAVEALERPCPEVLVTRLDLGERTGFDLMAEFQRLPAPPRTIVFSPSPTSAECRRAYRLGASGFLSQPFRIDELIASVEASTMRPAAVFERSYCAASGAVERCPRELAAFALRCAVSPTTRARIATAASELVENAVRHAFLDDTGLVEVRAVIDDRECVLSVTDSGRGFDADGQDEASATGLARVRCLAESLEISSKPGGGTRVTARFGASRVDFDDGRTVDLSEFDYLTPDTVREVLQSIEVDDLGEIFQLSPSIAVVIGRLLNGSRSSQAPLDHATPPPFAPPSDRS
jgi:CheY-like chemotaxis protein